MRIFIGSLAYIASAEEVSQAFSELGFTLENLQIMTDRETNRPRGFAFAECDDHRVCEHMNNVEICGRRIVVNEAKPKEQRQREWKGDARRQWHE